MDVHSGNLIELKISLQDSSSVGAVVDHFVEGTPFCTIDLVVLWRWDSVRWFQEYSFFTHSVSHHILHLVYFEERLLSVSVYYDKLLVAVGELYLLKLDDTTLDLQFCFLITIACVEDLNTLSCGSSNQIFGVLGHVDRLA